VHPCTSRLPPSSPPKSIEIKELEVDSDELGALSVSSDARVVCLYSFDDRGDLHDQALLALAALASQESSASGRLKHLTHAVVGLG
jgi:hypothetical protein